MMLSLLTALLLLPAPASGRGVRAEGRRELAPDRIEMIAGKVHEGRILRIGEDSVVLRVGTRDQVLEREGIASMRSSLLTLPAALRREEALSPSDYVGQIAAAELLVAQNLPLEADLLYWRALLANPANEAAHLALGHKQRRGTWVVPHRGRLYPLDRLQEERADWGGAWEFATTHFDLRSNLELPVVLDSCWGLERTYRGFFDLFGADLELYEITEPMEVWLHADEPSFEEPGSGRRAYFAAAENRVSIDASQGLALRSVVRETTHQLLYNASQSKGGSGVIPAWLDYGLAQYMETVLDVRGGASALSPGRANGRLFATHALADKPYRLNRVLNFDTGDYWASTRLGEKYAQAYTLVHFCLHGADGAYRTAFLRYVREAFQGKGSSTHFKKAMEVDERTFEFDWSAYVAAATGRR